MEKTPEKHEKNIIPSNEEQKEEQSRLKGGPRESLKASGALPRDPSKDYIPTENS